MKKILVVYPGFPHYRKGVIEKLLESKKFDFYFIGDKMMMNSSIRPYDFVDNPKFINSPSFYLGPLLFHKNMIKYIRQNDFDAYIFHSAPYWLTIYFAVIYTKFKKKIIFNWTHGILYKAGSKKAKIFKLFYKPFDGFLLYGSFAKQNMIQDGFLEDRLTVIFNSLDYEAQIGYRNSATKEELFELRKKLFSNPLNYQLLFIGRLTVQKKLPMLIAALKILKEKGVNVNLLIVGDGTERLNLIQEVIDNNLQENVCFYGASYDEQTNYRLIASSDCCVSPGEVGLTAIHSLMYGTPVITHNDFEKQMPEYESIVSGLNGEFFEFDNIGDMVNSIITCMNYKGGKNKLREDCYKMIDEIFNPTSQQVLIEESLNKFLK
jgi:glycosyltransferase involved in cell wall biosynthesis